VLALHQTPVIHLHRGEECQHHIQAIVQATAAATVQVIAVPTAAVKISILKIEFFNKFNLKPAVFIKNIINEFA